MRRLTYIIFSFQVFLTIYAVLSFFVEMVPYHPILTPLTTLVAFSFALLHGWQHLGRFKVLLLLGLTFSVSLLLESIGVATGLVYGPYHYTHKLGPLFLGLVPYLIPVAWFMMTYPSYVIARRLVGRSGWLVVAAVGGIIMTAWDLAMDPMMVAGEHWVWETQGAYFGVPLQNYWGWWLTTFLTFSLLGLFARLRRSPTMASELRFERLAVASYALTGLSSVLVNLRAGLGGPALAGVFAMLPWIILGWQERRA
ncbi:MAG: carotenoid biosynthesis protein [Anaerolineales bacterium]|nr:carotenoid biosynthesis protein [Anaerolineales bacterium]